MWLPDAVLHSVMPVFTFMGNTLLRQGDNYSAHVIDKTVSRVVPPLVASLKKRSHEVVPGVVDVLVSFTAAFEHIPTHRRLSLFEQLANALGPSDCLYAVVIMILDRYPTDIAARNFARDLLNQFDSGLVLKVWVVPLEEAANVP
jgi:U3 small nucleolar RNA-associated protein 10